MIPVYQDLSVKNDGTGNCFNACVASILGRPLREVAAIYPRTRVVLEDGSFRLEDNIYWHYQWSDWLLEQGYEIEYHLASEPPKGFSIASGYSDRIFPDGHPNAGEPISHAVVAFDGVPVHDPFPLKGEFYNIYSYKTLVPIKDTKDETTR